MEPAASGTTSTTTAPDKVRELLRKKLSEPRAYPHALTALLTFDLQWSKYGPQTLDRLTLSEQTFDSQDGIRRLGEALASIPPTVVPRDDADDDARLAMGCAAPLGQPVVREEVFRALYLWLERADDPAVREFAHEQRDAFELAVLCSLTDTWSAVRRASARALGGAWIVPLLGEARLASLCDRALAVSEGLLVQRGFMVAAAAGVQATLDGVRSGRVRRELRYGSGGDDGDGDGSENGSAIVPGPAAGSTLISSSSLDVSAWKAHEGLMLGISAMVRAASDAGGPLEPARFDALRPTLYRLLAHAQTSVRETAQTAYLAALSASGPESARASFSEVFVKLRDARPSTAPDPAAAVSLGPASPYARQTAAGQAMTTRSPTVTNGSNASALLSLRADAQPHVFRPETPPTPSSAARSTAAASALLPAFEAEGLLGLAAAMLPALQATFLLRNWADYWYVLEPYLSHPASTVRQCCSLFFRRLLEAGPPQLGAIFARLLLQSLGVGWSVDVPDLADMNATTPSPGAAPRRLAPRCVEVSPHSSTRPVRGSGGRSDDFSTPAARATPGGAERPWQWREGRLLALELIYAWILKEHTSDLGVSNLAPSQEAADVAATPLSFRRPVPSANTSMGKAAETESPGLRQQQRGTQKLPMLLSLVQRHPSVLLSGDAAATRAAEDVSPLGAIPPLRPPSSAPSVPEWAEDGAEAWLASLDWQPFELCLQHNLLQVTRCFADARFEIRRMADQLLRPMAEVAMWAQLPLLRQQWDTFLPHVDSLPCWVAASTMLLVLQRTHELRHVEAPSVQAHIASVRSLLPSTLHASGALVESAESDKVFVLAMRLLSLHLVRFGDYLGAVDEADRNQHAIALTTALLFLHAEAHATAKSRSDTEALANGAAAAADSHLGMLSRKLKLTRLSTSFVREPAHAQLLERTLLSALQLELPLLPALLPAAQRALMLALLMHHASAYVDGLDDDQAAPLLPSLLDALGAGFASMVEEDGEQQQRVHLEADFLEDVLGKLLESPCLTATNLRRGLVALRNLECLRKSDSLRAVLDLLCSALQRRGTSPDLERRDSAPSSPAASRLVALIQATGRDASGDATPPPQPFVAPAAAAEGMGAHLVDVEVVSATAGDTGTSDGDSDWDDWDDDEPEAAAGDASQLLPEVGAFCWWLAHESRTAPLFVRYASALDRARAGVLLAALRSTDDRPIEF